MRKIEPKNLARLNNLVLILPKFGEREKEKKLKVGKMPVAFFSG